MNDGRITVSHTVLNHITTNSKYSDEMTRGDGQLVILVSSAMLSAAILLPVTSSQWLNCSESHAKTFVETCTLDLRQSTLDNATVLKWIDGLRNEFEDYPTQCRYGKSR